MNLVVRRIENRTLVYLGIRCKSGVQLRSPFSAFFVSHLDGYNKNYRSIPLNKRRFSRTQCRGQKKSPISG